MMKDRYLLKKQALVAAVAFTFTISESAYASGTLEQISIDDIVTISNFDQAAESPDRSRIAVTVSRPALAGELYGRTHFDVDTSRSDIWIVEPLTGKRTNLTNGRELGQGNWCPIWSPDSNRIAYLSTDTVQIYDRREPRLRLKVVNVNTLRQEFTSRETPLSQTRTGGTIFRVSITRGNINEPFSCKTWEENAFFAWIDNTHLVFGAIHAEFSGLVNNEYGNVANQAQITESKISRGIEPTNSEMEGNAPALNLKGLPKFDLVLADVLSDSSKTILTSKIFPFWGTTTLNISDKEDRIVLSIPQGLARPTGFPLDRENANRVESKVCLLVLHQSNTYCTQHDIVGSIDKLRAAGSHFVAYAQMDGKNYRFIVEKGQVKILPDAKIKFAEDPTAELADLPPYSTIFKADSNSTIYASAGYDGTSLWYAKDSKRTKLWTLNSWFGTKDWGKKSFFKYTGKNGKSYGAKVLAPTGVLTPAKTIFWLYPGNVETEDDGYFTDPSMSGFYNLYTYLRSGFTVIIPSLPFEGNAASINNIDDLVEACADEAIRLGLTEPRKMYLLGQSFGGYAVAGVVTKSNRFAAAAAISGIYDLTAFPGEFDPLSRGFGAIEHLKSANPYISENKPFEINLTTPDGVMAALENSPLFNANKINTPTLFAHADLDIRASATEAERIFSNLSRRAIKSRLVRYWGESHAINRSPANVLNLHKQVIDWFSRF